MRYFSNDMFPSYLASNSGTGLLFCHKKLSNNFVSPVTLFCRGKKQKLGPLKILFFLLGIFAATAAFSQVIKYPLVRTPQNVTVNRKVPKDILTPNEPVTATFSKEPTDEEIYRVHFFEEPLVPMNGKVSPRENIELIQAVAAFSQRKNPDDFAPLLLFLQNNPQGRWNGAILANLGVLYRRTGYYNKALEAWEQAWKLLKTQSEHKAKVLGDRVISELLLINSWVGRQAKMDSIFSEISNRVMEGPAVERVLSMRSALSLMKNRPGVSFKCGPFALNKILTLRDSTKPFSDSLMAVQSTARGFSLTELFHLSKAIHLNYQMAFRQPGAPLIPQALVHWKLDHYSALIKTEEGHVKCQDATMGTVYGQEFWLTPTALDSSASGYFLVPDSALPQGWRRVGESEGNKIFGKGVEVPDNGKHVTPDDPQEPKKCSDNPMAQSNVHLLAVSLHIYDQPVYYKPPVGPSMLFNVDYHQRDSYQPANFSYSNLGPKWTFNWLSYVQDDPNNTSANAEIYVMGGGARTFISFNTTTQSYAPELQTNDVLVRICPGCYELRHPDGSKEVYAQPDGNTSSGRKIFLTQKVDPAGNAITIMYDAALRVVALKDAIGQVTSLTYSNSADSYKITKVSDPFGRSANFGYDASGRLNKITDMIGIVSSFQYDAAGDFINKMTTPYGSTGFVKQEGNGTSVARVLQTNYPLGEKERVEYLENAAGINMSESLVPTGVNLLNTYLVYRNTFFWDKKAMKEAPGNYAKAKIYHWLHGAGSLNESGTAAPVLESVKLPLESRVWYYYQDQSSTIFANQGMSSRPAQTGQVLDDSTTRLTTSFYNSLGKDTLSIDPLGRKMSYKYDANNIDLLEIRQKTNNANDLLAKFTYNSQHQILTSTDPAGFVTTYTYNSKGQPLTIKNPKNEITTLTYNASGYLQKVTGPTNAATTYAYDGFGRLRTVTDPEGYKITTDYDALDRLTVLTYPDSTYEQFVYNRLDATHARDRMGRWSHTIYDSLARPTILQDALGRITQYIWCSCGSLAEIIDPLKQVTLFNLDLQGRLIGKTYSNGQGLTYKYENTTSRLKEVTDAKGQKMRYSYYNDDNLKRIDYVNAKIATPSVSYTYDSSYGRMLKMTDGTGTTNYTYKPVNSGPGSWHLSTVDGPLANDVISFGYDSLSRVIKRSINGVVSTTVFDAIGRVTSQNNSLGNFVYNYVNQTRRFSSIILPNGQSTVFSYFDNHGDQLLKEILNKKPSNTTLSKFNYEYDRNEQITKWTQQVETATPAYYSLAYDFENQLTSATQKNQSTSAIIKRYSYKYDKAGNRTSEQINNVVTSSAYNNLNQLTNQQNIGAMRFKGTVNEFSSVLVKNQTTADSAYAPVDSTNAFETYLKVKPGANNILITAKDYSGNNNTSTKSYNIAVTGGINNTLLYDSNGNTRSSATPQVNYEWDAVNRLVKVTSPSGVTEFVYDGLNRLVAEKLNGSVIKRWLWVETQLCEERNAAGSVTKRFFSQGEVINGTKYFFTFDHLGSIREMTDGSGNVAARYDYDPYGRKTKVSGAQEADFGFTGFYFNAANKLDFAMWRVYNANTARWLNRDPMEYAELLPEGSNIYDYVGNNPVNRRDLLGLYTTGTPVPIGPDANSIICKGGRLVVQNNNTGPGKECTQEHESNHIADWIRRYGPNLCSGVPDGQLPVGGPGYDEFLKKSECDAYKVGKKCRKKKLKTCRPEDKRTLEDEIRRDDAQIANVCS